MFFDSWDALVRVFVIGIIAYVALVFWLRVSGKRTLSKWNAFDFVVTVALGSTLATVLLSKQVALAEGVLALALLVALQYAITWTAVRSVVVQRLIKARPALLLYGGRFLKDALTSERVTESEIRAAIRGKGIAAVEDVYAVVLETDGSFSVIPRPATNGHSALAGVGNLPER